MAGRKKRDKYGRFKGKAGIKPYKSNLKGNKRKSPPGQVAPGKKGKGASKKRIAAGVALGVATHVALRRHTTLSGPVTAGAGAGVAYTVIKGGKKKPKKKKGK